MSRVIKLKESLLEFAISLPERVRTFWPLMQCVHIVAPLMSAHNVNGDHSFFGEADRCV